MTTLSFEHQREQMVADQIQARGVHDLRVLNAMRGVPREKFVSERYHEFAYEDAPLPIEVGQTISQPYIVALMLEAANIQSHDRVLEIGAGSGYATALISQLAQEVIGIEWHTELADIARARIQKMGYKNATIIQSDGTLGHPIGAPYDVIIVSAGGPDVPQQLLAQLAIGGRLVIPVGNEPRVQELLRIQRTESHGYTKESLGRVRFVPLIGAEGWSLDGHAVAPRRSHAPIRLQADRRTLLGAMIATNCEPINGIDDVQLDGLMERIGKARVVLIGESTHGTSEFYRMRNRITRELIQKKGFTIVALEADWPDTSVLNQHIRGVAPLADCQEAFTRFPSWMWRNRETTEFVEWLSSRILAQSEKTTRVSIYGLDLYSLDRSIGAVLKFLDKQDPSAAQVARVRYGCFSPWESDPATYGRATVSGRLPGCEKQAVEMLTDLLAMRIVQQAKLSDPLFDAQRNAKVIREAERYYRAMYYGSRESWNLRDSHMFETVEALLEHHGPNSKVVVWAHNSHVGDSAATEMSARGELNLGHLARQKFGEDAYLIGFGTDRGTVAAVAEWGDPFRIQRLLPSHLDSYERLCHASHVPAFLLPLRHPMKATLRDELMVPHLERAVGVVYRPETEILSHYMQVNLPHQFDEYIWFDETRAVTPVRVNDVKAKPLTYPFAL
jgi:protein-L-isoaspartate(D-aspartate) O-methyltransferase